MELEIQLDPQTNHVHIPIKIDGEGSFYFTLDTGAVATTVTPKLIEKFGIETYDNGLNEIKKPNIPHNYAKLPSLTIGSTSIENEEVMVSDLKTLLRGCTGELHSVLGHTTLKNYIMTLNYKTKKFKLENPDKKLNIEWYSFDYLEDTHLITIPVTINGEGPFPFVLDTGAGGTVISLEFANKLGLEPMNNVRVKGRGIGGDSEGFIALINEFATPSLKINNFTVFAIDLDKVSKRKGVLKYGVLGYNYLQNFEIIIDYPNKNIALIPLQS